MSDDVGLIFLVNTPSFRVHSTKVKGFQWGEDRICTLDSIYKVD